MNKKNPVTFFLSLFAFLVFGVISCWATSESLFLSFRGGAAFPKIVFWVIVVGFFIVTSLGTKMIIDSFSTTKPIDTAKRRLMLVGGILIVICFWLLVSMPTNAHTFLYKRSAKTVAQKELKWQEGQLETITDIDAYVLKISSDFAQQMADVDQLTAALVTEIKHPDRPGYAAKAESILQDIERKLGIAVGTIPRMSIANRSENEINRVTKYYTNAISDQKDIAEVNHAKKISTLAAQYEEKVVDAKKSIKYIRAAYTALDADDEVQEDVLREARKQINHAYNVIDEHKLEGAESARDKYVDVEKGMPSNRLTNVVEIVYKDYLGGQLSSKYDMPETKGMIYFILLSILIDFAAFLFFNIAFKN